MSGENVEYFENWTRQARKGALELCILNYLYSSGECYGYEMTKDLVAMPVGITEGTIYPLLSRLRKQGLVNSRLKESAEGPARKYYSLSESGKGTIILMNRYWKFLNESVYSVEVFKDEME